METFKLLLVEDDAREIDTFTATLERYRLENKKNIDYEVVKNLEESISKLDNSFDGAIIDIKLNGDENAGNKVLDVVSAKFRIPVAVYTGTPDNVDISRIDWKRFQRGVGYDQPLNFLFEIYDTGITRILGGRGEIEQKMNQIFWNNALKHLENWKLHKSKGKDTEKALLRFIINHITELLDDDVEKYFPEEMYIDPPVILDKLKTGSVLKKKAGQNSFVVLSPACDIEMRNGKFKTNSILVCAIEDLETTLFEMAKKSTNTEILESDNGTAKADKLSRIEKAKKRHLKEDVSTNAKLLYLHYLPPTKHFSGGVINFRKIETLHPDAFSDTFEKPFMQISAAFLKDIVARFSSYYARQGQPEFDSD